MTILFDIGLIVTGMIAKYFVGENWVISTAMTKGLEDIIDRSKRGLSDSSKKDSEEINKICGRIVENILPLVRTEYKKGDYSAVFFEFTETISRAEIGIELLVALEFDSTALYEYIRDAVVNKKTVAAFSGKEESLYKDLIRSFSKEIVRVATVLNDFEITVSKHQLRNQAKILSILTSIYERPSQEEKAFGERYCSEIAKQLDRLEMFGIRRVDDVTRQQSLSIAYTTLEVEQNFGYDDGNDENIPETQKSIFMRRKEKHSKTHRARGKEKKTKPYWRNLSVDKLLQEGKRLLIVGDPGSGKTTLLKWVAIQTAQAVVSSNDKDMPIPFFIRLRECIDTGFPELEKFPQQTLKMIGGKPDNWVHRVLESGKGIVLIDGVDEMPVSARTDLLDQLSQLISLYPLAK